MMSVALEHIKEMHGLVNSTFNRTYNPSSGQNALSDIKRLLTSRDTVAQTKACDYLCEVINRYDEDSNERIKLIQYLLNNDITLFLCEAMSNLEWSLFKNILKCLRYLSHSVTFFEEEHDAHASSAIVRALVYYAGSGMHGAIDCSLQFICDLLIGVRSHGLTSPLSRDSAYSTEQLLACLNSIASKCAARSSTTLGAALVLQAVFNYQPENLRIRGSMAASLATTISQWFPLLWATLNQVFLLGHDQEVLKMYYVLICQLGVDVIRLSNVMRESKASNDFIQAIMHDEQEIASLLQSSIAIDKYLHSIVCDLVNFTKENYEQIPTEEYEVFLILLHTFLKENKDCKVVIQFSDFLFANNYLTFLPRAHIERKNLTIRKVSTLVLGEILSSLAKKYLAIDGGSSDDSSCYKEVQSPSICRTYYFILDSTCDFDLPDEEQVHKRRLLETPEALPVALYHAPLEESEMGLVELQYGIERPQILGQQLQKSQSSLSALFIYLYFYCQSTENSQDAMSQILPHLVQHILCLPRTFNPPKYIVKCMWLVFAMSTVSNTSLKSLTGRVYLEKATEKFIGLLQDDPSLFYTHNPAILLWVFISQRIPVSFRISVVSLWFELEDTLPAELASQSFVWDALLYILKQNTDQRTIKNITKALMNSLESIEEERKQCLATVIWFSLPEMLSQVLIDMDKELNARYILELATVLTPTELDPTVCLKIAVLISSLFAKSATVEYTGEERLHYVYSCLKLSLFLLPLAKVNKDSRVLVTYVNRTRFLAGVLQATYCPDDKVACVALQLLSWILHYHGGHSQPKILVQVETDSVVKCLKRHGLNERGAALLQFVYMILSSGANSPLILSTCLPNVDENQPYTALRCLMFRVQMMCCKESKTQSSAGWKTLNAIFKNGIITKIDAKLVTILTTQPWMHYLIQFQITQNNICKDFLLFTYTWLTFINIIIKKQSRNDINVILYKDSFMCKTLMLLNKSLTVDEDDDDEMIKNDILNVVKTILGNTSSSNAIEFGMQTD